MNHVIKFIRHFRGYRVPLILCGIFGFGFIIWDFFLVQSKPPIDLADPRLLITKRNLTAGAHLQFADLGFVPRGRAKKNVPPGALTDGDLELVSGARLLTEVAAEEFLTREMIGGELPLSDRLEKGMRAYALNPQGSVAVRRGDRVDILAAGAGEVGTTLAEAALVLSAGMRMGKPEVVVSVRSDDIELLERAAESGKLTIALRHPSDLIKRHRSRKSNVRPPKRGHPPIEVWTD